MLEFKSKTRGSDRSVTLYLMLAVVAIAAITVFLLIRYQQNQPGEESGDPVVVVGMVRPGDPDFEYYRHKIRIESVKASLGINFAQSRIAIVSGIITNGGDRKLEALEMHISLYDMYDKVSKERTATPLRPGVGLKRPMEPLEKRSFTVYIEPIDYLWNPRRLEIELTGLKYQ